MLRQLVKRLPNDIQRRFIDCLQMGTEHWEEFETHMIGVNVTETTLEVNGFVVVEKINKWCLLEYAGF